MKTEYLLVTEITPNQSKYVENELKLFENYENLNIFDSVKTINETKTIIKLEISTEKEEVFLDVYDFLILRLIGSNIEFNRQVKFTKGDSEDQEFNKTVEKYKNISPFGYLMSIFANRHDYIYVEFALVKLISTIESFETKEN